MADLKPPPVQLDAVREALRERGYLEGRLSLWIATGRGGAASLARVALAASLRVGAIGGPILAAPASAAVALANRPHLDAPRDLALLWLILSALLGIALAALELVADLALAWLGRRGLILLGRTERLAGRIGLLFAAAASLYLIVYVRGGWLASGAGERRPGGPPGWILWAAVLLAALGAGHLVGRLARLGSLATIASRSAGVIPLRGGGGRVAGGRAAAFAFWGGALAAGVAIVFMLPAERLGAEAAPAVARVAVPQGGGRVMLVAVDGLDAATWDGTIASGDHPLLESLAASSARHDLLVDDPAGPPAVWTTAATGRHPDRHGVTGYQALKLPVLSAPVQAPADPRPAFSFWLLLPPRMAGGVPVSGGLRRLPAVWEILSRHGVPAAALNWWATWPADASEGAWVVSERAFVRLLSGRRPDRDASPPWFQEAIAARFREDSGAALARARKAGLERPGPASQAATADLYHAGVALRLFRESRPRLLCLYMPALDIARRSDPEATGGVLSALEMGLGDIMAALDPEDLLLVVGHPGRSEGKKGILLAAGGGVQPGQATEIKVIDLAPTLLALSGLPPGRDMEGRVVLISRTTPRAAQSDVPTYGGRPFLEPEVADPFDQEVLDRLRSLGYIQE